MQLVKHVIELLQRFNPDAVMAEEVDIQSTSPQTSCSISIVGSETIQEKLTELESDNDFLRKQNGMLIDQVTELSK